MFRAEWLRHRIVRLRDSKETDRHRLAYLRKLFLTLDQYEGIEEVRQFRETVILAAEREDRKAP